MTRIRFSETVVPVLVGVMSLLLVPPHERPRGLAAARTVLQGYPSTIGLALALVVLAVAVPLRWLSGLALSKCRAADHHAAVIPPIADEDGGGRQPADVPRNVVLDGRVAPLRVVFAPPMPAGLPLTERTHASAGALPIIVASGAAAFVVWRVLRGRAAVEDEG